MKHKFLQALFVTFITSTVSISALARGGGGHGGHTGGGTGSSHSSTHVSSYTTRSGTYVPSYYRSTPDHSFNNNWSTKGNYNPYTGKAGTRVTPPKGSHVYDMGGGFQKVVHPDGSVEYSN